MIRINEIIYNLSKNQLPSECNFVEAVNNISAEEKSLLFSTARNVCATSYDNRVFMRGLIEFSSYCKQNCKYCGLRASNNNAQRYRLSEEEILDVCESGHEIGFNTFVLQGGEDPYFDDEKIVSIVEKIKNKYPECAVTLSIGEKSRESYQKYFDAGADRYLLRHETASKKLYSELHPGMDFDNRVRCLWDLKEIGFQVGAGFMVGLPGQSASELYQDLSFLKELQPHMVGIGPFIPHKDTPLANENAGTLEMTLIMIAFVRLILPQALMPATTALGTIDPQGRESGVLAGANVVMPNLSPSNVREKYSLYDNKICVNDAAEKCRYCIERKINLVGYEIDMSRGDHSSRGRVNVCR